MWISSPVLSFQPFLSNNSQHFRVDHLCPWQMHIIEWFDYCQQCNMAKKHFISQGHIPNALVLMNSIFSLLNNSYHSCLCSLPLSNNSSSVLPITIYYRSSYDKVGLTISLVVALQMQYSHYMLLWTSCYSEICRFPGIENLGSSVWYTLVSNSHTAISFKLAIQLCSSGVILLPLFQIMKHDCCKKNLNAPFATYLVWTAFFLESSGSLKPIESCKN